MLTASEACKTNDFSTFKTSDDHVWNRMATIPSPSKNTVATL